MAQTRGRNTYMKQVHSERDAAEGDITSTFAQPGRTLGHRAAAFTMYECMGVWALSSKMRGRARARERIRPKQFHAMLLRPRF